MSSFASLWGVPYLTTVNHFTQNTAAFLCSLMWLGLALGSPIVGIVSTVLNNRVLPLIVTSSMGITAFGLLLHFNFSQTAVGVLLFFAGVACTGQVLCFTLVKDNNHQSIRGTAIAFNNMAVVISGALFQPIIGKVIELGHQNTITYDANNYKNGAYIILATYILAFITALFFIKESDEEKLNIDSRVRKATI
jgi:sugar phosphate permease